MLSPSLVDRARAEVRRVLPDILDLRQEIHRCPEVGVDTYETRRRIAEALSETSIEAWRPLIGADFIGEIHASGDETVCLRADIDALPIQEESDLPYRSAFPGSMHACGHDGHAAMLVGAARVLDSMSEHLRASVRFVFQPGEEVVAAGRTMVELGACEGCSAAYAVHGWPGIPEGCLTTREGTMFAAGSFFTFTVTGKGCHGALPEIGRNPIPAAARGVLGLQRLHERLCREDGTVVSVCALQAGEGVNIIPDAARVKGTARFLSAGRSESMEVAIRDAFISEASESGLTVDCDYRQPYSLPVINSGAGYELVRSLSETHFVPSTWRELPAPLMTNEDFAYYLDGRDGAMVFLGLGETFAPLHTAKFDFNEGVLETGMLLHVLLALSNC